MDKPYKTFDEQIEILKNRGLIVDDSARQILAREGYYSVVNGYKDLFLDKEAMRSSRGVDRYIKGATFENMHRMFIFDRDLRMVMFRYFAIAEAVLKTACSYVFAEKYQDTKEAYLDKRFYNQNAEKQKHAERLIKKFEKILGRSVKGGFSPKREYIEHYVTKHDEVPIWVLMNYLSLGQVFQFYDFQTESIKNSIAKYFLERFTETHTSTETFNHRRLRLAYDHIKDFRNICAHDERFYCARVSPSKDKSIADVMNDLGLVLTKDENQKMITEVSNLIVGVITDINRVEVFEVLGAMGFDSIEHSLGVLRD